MFNNVAESCLLIDIGLTRGECASWVQAWGTVLALGVAILVSYLQGKKQTQISVASLRADWYLKRLTAAESLNQIAIATTRLFENVCDEMKDREAIENAAIDNLPWLMPEVSALANNLDGIDLHLMPSDIIGSTLILRMTLREFLDKVTMTLRLQRKMSAEEFEDFFSVTAQMKKSLDSSVQAIEKNIDKLEAEYKAIINS